MLEISCTGTIYFEYRESVLNRGVKSTPPLINASKMLCRASKSFDNMCSTVILLPAHPASFVHKFLFQRVPASPGME